MIRMVEIRDASAIAGIYRPFVEESAISFETTAPDETEFEDRINKCIPIYPWLIAEQDGDVLGYAYGSGYRSRTAYQWSVEVSVYVDRNFHRRGIACLLYKSLFHCLNLQGYRNALAGTTLPNDPSVRFHKAMGFREIGTYPDIGYKFGKWHSVLWLSRKLTDNSTPPSEIKTTNEIAELPQFQQVLENSN